MPGGPMQPLYRPGLGGGYVPQRHMQEDLDRGDLKIVTLPGIQLQSVHLVRNGSRELLPPERWLTHHRPHRSSIP